jgi:catecholate siderophore receptor
MLNRFFIDLPHPSHLIPGEVVNAQIVLNFKF